jgi:L-fuconolactonase
MRIDAHQHFWIYDPARYEWIDDTMQPLRRDFLPQHLRSETERARIDGTIAVQACQSVQETEWLLGLAGEHAFILGVVGWVDLQADDVERELERVSRNPKLVGVRHVVQSEPDDRFLLSPAFCRGIAVLRSFSLRYDILIHARHLPVAAEFVSRFPDQPFVLDHLAKPEIRSGAIDNWAGDLRRLAQATNVQCKVSGLVTEANWRTWTPAGIEPYLDVAFDAFGADRLMAGSDWPVCTVAADYSRTMSVVTGYLERRPGPERDAVLGDNAVRFYGL